MKYRTMPNGFRVFPSRSEIPPDQPGYERDIGDPYTFIPIMPDCDYRISQRVRLPCGKMKLKVICQKGYTPSADNCAECILSGQRDG